MSGLGCAVALGLGAITSAGDLPRGRIEAAEAGQVRLVEGPRDAVFDHTLPLQGLKRIVYPAEERLFRTGPDLVAEGEPVKALPLAVFGVRPCDLAALDTLTSVFEGGPFVDARFRQRRESLLLVAVNCTRPAATCFCGAVEDRSSLDGSEAERWRRWDSCFTLGFGYLHGGAVRRETASPYRQWITHKLAHWHDQFGSSGCVGCGRCIGWCLVGIDITAEVAALAATGPTATHPGEDS